MIHFPRLRTARLDVQLRELTLREAVELAATPLERHEAATSAFLRRVVESADGEHSQPGRWTVQERMLVVAHYLSCTSDTSANFEIGDGRFLDYLHAQIDTAPESAPIGTACGDAWTIRQLSGDEAEAIEPMCQTRMDWISADMAARLRVVGDTDEVPDATDKPAVYSGWLMDRKADIESMPESEFVELFAAYRQGLSALHHLFTVEFDPAGHIAMPKPAEGGADLAPARFPVAAALSGIARILGA